MKNQFQSILADELSSFLEYKHAMGFKYVRPEGTLLSFDRFMNQNQKNSLKKINWKKAIENWIARPYPRKTISVANDLQVIRQFCLYRRRSDPAVFVPEVDWNAVGRKSHFLPYIYSVSDIKNMAKAARNLTVSKSYNQCLHLLVYVLYCTGLRFGEAARLEILDLDLKRRILHIRQSKGRSRLVPFRGDLSKLFKCYLKIRTVTKMSPDSPLFLNYRGDAFTTKTISYGIGRLLREIGLKKQADQNGPRPYDLRHTFAVHRLSRWYRRGVDPVQRLPWLSVYMGHGDILGTETYLTTTPELQKLIAKRFEALFKKGRQVV